jgi:ribosome recycling factor
MTKDFIAETKDRIQKAEKALGERFSGLRAGRASPSLLEHISVEAYGGRAPLSQVATVNAPEARLLTVQVWDQTVIGAVDKAIQAAGMMPIVEGLVLRVPLPELSDERRKELVKLAKGYCDEAKVGLRNIRRDIFDAIGKSELPEDQEHRLKSDLEKIIKDGITKLDTLLTHKEGEILKV